MATPVVTVAAGGLPVVDVTATTPKLGLPVTEALNGRGMPVTKVAARGLPVTFSTVADYPPSNLVTNGNFTQNPLNAAPNTVQNGWQWRTTPGTGTATVTWNGSNAVTLTGDGTNSAQISTSIPTVAGGQYQITVDVASAVLNVLAGVAAFQNTLLNATSIVGAGQAFLFTATGTSSFVTFSKPAAASATVSNVSVTYVPPVGGGGAGAEAAAWLARATTLDAAHAAADAALIDGLVADGIWSALDALHIYATQNATTALLNLVSAVNYNATANGAVVFTADRGYTGVALSSTASVNTNLNAGGAPAKIYAQNAAHFSVWCVNDIAANVNAVMGYGRTSPNWVSAIVPKHTDGNAYFRMNSSRFELTAYAAPNANGSGHFLANRNGVSAAQGYRNGAQIVNATANCTSTPAASGAFVTCGFMNDDVVTGVVNQVAVTSIGGPLTPTQVANFYARLRTRLTAVGVP